MSEGSEVPSGVPVPAEYERVIVSDLFREIESFSDGFLAAQKDLLADYSRKWTPDPLHTWSRQWEYPYVVDRIAQSLNAHASPCRILDAGSGLTFLPHYIQSRWPRASVTCMDRDSSLAPVYEGIDKRKGWQGIEYRVGDIDKTAFNDGQFDIVYCISVLEHTGNVESVVAELARVLTPGGLLIVTFDISIDARDDISVDTANSLLDVVRRSFRSVEMGNAPDGLRTLIAGGDTLTTHDFTGDRAKLLPWHYTYVDRLKALARMRILRIPYLTVCCLTANR